MKGIGGFFTDKVAGIPLWAWGLVGIGGVFVLSQFSKKKSSANATGQQPVTYIGVTPAMQNAQGPQPSQSITNWASTISLKGKNVGLMGDPMWGSGWTMVGQNSTWGDLAHAWATNEATLQSLNPTLWQQTMYNASGKNVGDVGGYIPSGSVVKLPYGQQYGNPWEPQLSYRGGGTVTGVP